MVLTACFSHPLEQADLLHQKVSQFSPFVSAGRCGLNGLAVGEIEL